jgi:hypothetical protein
MRRQNRHCERSEAIASALTHEHHGFLIRLLRRCTPHNDSGNWKNIVNNFWDTTLDFCLRVLREFRGKNESFIA